MVTKYLSGAYPGGYTLNGAIYSGLVIETMAKVGGTGVSASLAASIANYGTVMAAGADYGVYLHNGGTVINGSASDTTALIAGVRGVDALQGAAAVTNLGTIQGTAYGLYLHSGGAVTNFGTIEGTNAYGIRTGGGTVTNGSATDTAAVISGATGVNSYGTVTNFGTISGTKGPAANLNGAAARLIVESSAVFLGALTSEGGTLELAAGADTITGLGGSGVLTGGVSANLSGFGTYQVDAGVSLTLAGTLTTVQSLDVYGSLTNTGALTGGDGVTLTAGGTLTNGSTADRTALIQGAGDGVLALSASAAIANHGTIEATSGFGVVLEGGGAVVNGSASYTNARIAGSNVGVLASGTAATVTNFGTIKATSGFGVILDAGGTVTNGSASDLYAAYIYGRTGVYAGGPTAVTITNFGAIGGRGGTAVQFKSAADRLIVESTAVFTNAGLIETTGKGALTIKSVVANTGTIMANGGTLTLDAAVSGSGAVTIAAGTLDIANAGAAETVGFAGKSGKLELAHSRTYTGGVTGFSISGRTSFDLRDIGFVSPTEATFHWRRDLRRADGDRRDPCRQDHPDRRLSGHDLHRQQRQTRRNDGRRQGGGGRGG